MRSLSAPYPSGRDIRYARWLKQFAAQLPAYRERYQLDPLQVLQVQSLALEFLELLVCQLQYATAAIQHPQFMTAPDAKLLTQVADCKVLVQQVVAHVTADIAQHSAVAAADGYTLELLLAPQQLPVETTIMPTALAEAAYRLA